MHNRTTLQTFVLIAVIVFSTACAPVNAQPQAPARPNVLVIESFLADITQNVAGDRLTVKTLIPEGVDPHAFDPSPRDIARIADCNLLVINGAGLEGWLEETLQNAGGSRDVVEASKGLEPRTPSTGELDIAGEHQEQDPHFWLNPLNAIQYVENIRAGLTALDPEGADIYAGNARTYTEQLKALDVEIQAQVETIPQERRVFVTNHESFGYFADRYNLTIIGTVIPSVSTDAAPSAQQMARLIDRIREIQAPAIFLEAGANPKLAQQIAVETGIKVVTGLYTHSTTPSDGPASTYLNMMRENTRQIVEALK